MEKGEVLLLTCYHTNFLFLGGICESQAFLRKTGAAVTVVGDTCRERMGRALRKMMD